MLVLGERDIRELVPLPALVDALEKAFQQGNVAPGRSVVHVPGGGERLLLMMPAYDRTGGGVVKLATIFPGNPLNGMPAIQGVIVAFSVDGTPVAVLDGTIVTKLRTGATSALASRYLSKPDSQYLAIVGTGALAPYMAAAHCAVRSIREIKVWGRSESRGAITVEAIRSLVASDIDVSFQSNLELIITGADIVSCATSCTEPLIDGRWLRPGTFLDLVGSFLPTKREADDAAIKRSRLFVDTIEGALNEAGDILIPISAGVINPSHIEGELADLVCKRVRGRGVRNEIIVFKSVGSAIEDLATVHLALASELLTSRAHLKGTW